MNYLLVQWIKDGSHILLQSRYVPQLSTNPNQLYNHSKDKLNCAHATCERGAIENHSPVVIVRGERHAANLRLERAESRADVVIRTTTSLTGQCGALLRRSSRVRIGQVDQVDRTHVRNGMSLVPGDCWDLGQGSSSAGQSDGQGEDVELHGG